LTGWQEKRGNPRFSFFVGAIPESPALSFRPSLTLGMTWMFFDFIL